ncbi:putative retrotransposon protein [Tanacetum coccineum]
MLDDDLVSLTGFETFDSADDKSKEGTGETFYASADMPAQSDPLGHLHEELRILNNKIDQLESSITKKVTDDIQSSVPSIVCYPSAGTEQSHQKLNSGAGVSKTQDNKKWKQTSELIKEVFVKENVVVDGMHRNLAPPPGVEGRRALVIHELEAGIFYYNGNFDLVFQRESEFHLATTIQLVRLRIHHMGFSRGRRDVQANGAGKLGVYECDVTKVREIVKDNLDGMGQHMFDIRSIRILIAIVAFYDYEIWQMDVKTAFLNEHLFEEVYMVQPEGELHWTDVKNILKYLRNTKDIFLVYGGDIKLELRVSCYTDAGYLTDADDLKSQTGYVFILNGGVVDRKSTKQSIFTTSFAEAENIATLDASKEAVWVRKLISGLSVVPIIEEPIKMYYDNTGAITIANESGITKGARHYQATVHYLREL